MSICNAFTIDVEDYFQVSAFEDHVNRNNWLDYESRVVANTRKVLHLLQQHDVKATFFVLGWVAQHHPDLIKEIHAEGHEIGSHSYWHRLVYELTEEEFRKDLLQSRKIIEDIIGQPVTSYRAPSFSITNKSLWALDALAEEGFRIDSSIFPIHHDRYGIPDAEPRLHQLQTASGPLWEFPVSVRRVAGINFPVSGGGYFRLYPLGITTRCLAKINSLGQPFVFYIHPWEVDPDQPRVPVRSRVARARHYVNLGSTHRKLDELLSRFSFGTLSNSISNHHN